MSKSIQRPLGDEDFADAFLEADEELLLEAQLDAHNKARNSLNGYACDFARYERWCNREGISALPTQVMSLVRYLKEASLTITENGDEKYAHATLERWSQA